MMAGSSILIKKSLTFCGSVAMVGAIAFIDYETGPQYSLLLFYLVPVLHATWFVGRRAGIAISFISVVIWAWSHYIIMPGEVPRLVPIWNASIRLAICLLITYILSIQVALRRALEKEREMSRTDFVTGAMNSRAFSELAEAELVRCRRYEHPLSLAFIDLDNFKMVNDKYGHKTGDILLRRVVETIRSNVRRSDIVARIGGDEFVILFPETGDSATELAIDKLQKSFCAEMDRDSWPVTMSIGVVTCLGAYPPLHELLSKADELMYEAKQGGKRMARFRVLSGG